MAGSKGAKKVMKIVLVAVVMLSLFFSILAPVVLAATDSEIQKINAQLKAIPAQKATLEAKMKALEKAKEELYVKAAAGGAFDSKADDKLEQQWLDTAKALDDLEQKEKSIQKDYDAAVASISSESPEEQTKIYETFKKDKESEYNSLSAKYEKTQEDIADLQEESDAAHAELEAAEKFYASSATSATSSNDPALKQYQDSVLEADAKLADKKAESDKLADDMKKVQGEYKDLNDKVKNVSGSGYDPKLDPKTLIPNTNLDQQKCFNVLYALQISDSHNLETLSKADLEKLGVPGTQLSATQVLGCAIKTGLVKLWMLPLFIKYIIDFLLSVAGLIAVLFLMVGGYLYMFGGLSADKEQGKNAIIYGIAGFIVALLAWVVVNAIQLLVTSA